jgi:hypothetical protein
MQRTLLSITVFLVAAAAPGQIRSVTLGITTHCPYGVGGCWAEIRNGLNLPDAIEAIPKRPDTGTQTFNLAMRSTWVPDPGLFARNFTNMNVGVDVRGVEAMVDGLVEMAGTNLVLRITNNATVLRLAPLTQKVQWDVKRKRPEPATRAELKAFRKLAADARQDIAYIRVTGPLLQQNSPAEGEPHLLLQVRKFEHLGPPSL